MKTNPRGNDRRTLIVEVPLEQRRSNLDRRRCPDCGGAVLEKLAQLALGHYFIQFCNKCTWKTGGKRLKRDETIRLITCKGTASVTGRTSSLELPKNFLNFSGVRNGGKVTLRPVLKAGVKNGRLWEIEID